MTWSRKMVMGLASASWLAIGVQAPAAQTEAGVWGAQPIFALSDAKSRSISPENLTGGRGQGGRTPAEKGSAAAAARNLGLGWKVNPYMDVAPGATLVLGEAAGPGLIGHIWMTLGGGVDYRSAILRMYWDGEATPSVESPVGDFFAAGWGRGNEPTIDSQAVAVNAGSGFNSFWPMPFRKSFKITLQNRGKSPLRIYYSINYSLTEVPRNAGYFHAQFRMVDRMKPREVYTILDGVKGKGQYVGTYLGHGAFSPGWWGEGEVKFYIDGDRDFPTIAGTGEEDYFLGSYGYMKRGPDGKRREGNYSTLYSGFYALKPLEPGPEYLRPDSERRYGEYRWHIPDPIRFEHDLRVTIQNLGWSEVSPSKPLGNGTYLPLQDYLASVAFWYQTEPHAPFPTLPDDTALALKPVQGQP